MPTSGHVTQVGPVRALLAFFTLALIEEEASLTEKEADSPREAGRREEESPSFPNLLLAL